jgi:hypothetical protein
MGYTICEKCGAYTHEWSKEEEHGFVGLEPCPNMTNEQVRNKLIQYFKVFQEHSKRDSDTRSNAQIRINKAKKQEVFWKGKFFEVKIENNSLRKTLVKWMKK